MTEPGSFQSHKVHRPVLSLPPIASNCCRRVIDMSPSLPLAVEQFAQTLRVAAESFCAVPCGTAMASAGNVCRYYLNGNCRFGEKCWNVHPRPGEGSIRTSSPSSGSSRRGGWDGRNQRYPVVQASSFSKASNWHSNRDHGRTFHGPQADLGLSQNRFAALNSNEDVCGEDEKLLEMIMKDMEVWESSGQWMFSSYSPLKDKPNISGFATFSPEELRLEYYNCRANNNIQSYVSSVQQLVTQWRSRLLELKNINASTKTALISELKNVANQPPSAFGFGGQQSSAFGASAFPVNEHSSANTFSFKSPVELANISSGNLPAFGSLPGVQNHPSLGATSSSTTTTTTHSGFGFQPASSAASFSFKSSASPGGFGTSGFSGFGHSLPTSSSNNTSAPVFGASNTTTAAQTLDSRNTLFGQPTNAVGSSGAFVSSLAQTNNASEKLFTPKAELSADELKQFEAKKFTLGKIPLKPPPVELLSV